MAVVAVLALACGAVVAQQAPDGASVYDANCASCHGASGDGGVGPALAGNQTLADAEAVVLQVLRGGAGMPAFAGPLTDAQIAAVASHIRTSWGNEFGAVEPSLVGELRDGGGAEAGEDPEADDPAQGETPADRDASEDQDDADPQDDADQQDDTNQQDDADEQEQANEQDDADEQDDTDQADEADAQDDGQQQDGVDQQEEAQQPDDEEASEDPVQPDADEGPAAQEPPDAGPPAPGEEAAPAPDRTATLVIRVEPESASVEVVGPTGFEQVSREGGEITFEAIPVGPYRVTVRHGDDTFVQLVDLTRGGRAEVVFELSGGGG